MKPTIRRRRGVALDMDAQVERGFLVPGRRFPRKIAAAERGGVDALAWLSARTEEVREDLRRYGAVLLRGLALSGTAGLEEVVRRVAGRDLADYDYRSTPRKRVEGRVYTSTEYPPDQGIPFHNEVSYARSWPRLLCFWCRQPAEQGGETPLADSRAVLARLDPGLRRRFIEHGVMYIRNYGLLDLSWQEVFQTREPAEVEAYCARAGIEWEWKSGGRLTTRQVCQAVTTHLETGAEVWFNQAHLFHVSSLQPEVRTSLLALFVPEDLPRNACYGDGSPIADETIAAIHAAYEAESCAFPWEAGDLLLVDNVLVAHGRRPFHGRREILVAMS